MTPTPDGRGGEQRPATPNRPNPRWMIALLVVVLLALNFWISSQALKAEPRVRIPYSPTFLTQVKSGNVRGDLLDRRRDPGLVQDRGQVSGE